MSLDVYLTDKNGNCLYDANITHNLNKMAKEAGVYASLWSPDENGITKAAQIIELLRNGLMDMVARPTHYEQFNAPNGWGKYEHFLPFCAKYLEACMAHPDADVKVSR